MQKEEGGKTGMGREAFAPPSSLPPTSSRRCLSVDDSTPPFSPSPPSRAPFRKLFWHSHYHNVFFFSPPLCLLLPHFKLAAASSIDRHAPRYKRFIDKLTW